MDATTPLTGRSTIEQWLASPVGGPLLRGLLEQGGIDESSLAPARQLPLANLVEASRGRFTQEVVDQLVRGANGGELVEEEAPAPTAQRFTGRTTVVTGAGSGIGRVTARRILTEGGRVIALDINAGALAELAAAHPEGTVVPVTADVTTAEGIDAVLAATDGPVHGLANVAGITDGHRPLHETDDDVWGRVMAVNVDGPFRLMRALVPGMLEEGGGAIVNVASEASLRGSAAGTAYTVSKHAVVGLTRSAAFLYAPQGIRVNAVAPGPVATGIEGTFASEFSRARLGPFLQMIPPVTDADTLASSIAWLLSDDARNVSGVILPSDGGWSVQ
ncbi:SDR family oxidoreductase [Brachybacterium sp. NBEC-018]|uniref:SDR family NAD(P)-dependent oxidoreductase n=1 Tax=Brachybacterium sp. NBEC-018 TaxID=2996004 RepID=UPI0021753F21|nr:SDR family oxidoreductase [Brachybacterium sp. NBEC-018]UVY84948.1 SDR family oxidoreductase [Brachybacterium sp. NBEC-018]